MKLVKYIIPIAGLMLSSCSDSDSTPSNSVIDDGDILTCSDIDSPQANDRVVGNYGGTVSFIATSDYSHTDNQPFNTLTEGDTCLWDVQFTVRDHPEKDSCTYEVAYKSSSLQELPVSCKDIDETYDMAFTGITSTDIEKNELPVELPKKGILSREYAPFRFGSEPLMANGIFILGFSSSTTFSLYFLEDGSVEFTADGGDTFDNFTWDSQMVKLNP